MELHNLYSSLNVIRFMKWRMRRMGHVERMGEIINAYNIFSWRPWREETTPKT
jgi:hypothetical protein